MWRLILEIWLEEENVATNSTKRTNESILQELNHLYRTPITTNPAVGRKTLNVFGHLSEKRCDARSRFDRIVLWNTLLRNHLFLLVIYL